MAANRLVVCVGNNTCGNGDAINDTTSNGFTYNEAAMELTTEHSPVNTTRNVLVF